MRALARIGSERVGTSTVLEVILETLIPGGKIKQRLALRTFSLATDASRAAGMLGGEVGCGGELSNLTTGVRC